MTADELRRLAVLIERTDYEAIDRAAGYLRACADALDVGPVAWAATDETGKIVEALGMNGTRRFSDPLYLRPLPAPLCLPEPMTEDEISDRAREMVKGRKSVDWLARAIEAETLRRVKEANNG